MGHPQARGFTLLELMVVLAVAGILAGLSVWQIQRTLPGYRAAGAAARFLGAVRSAAAIAARTNQPIDLEVTTDGDDDCDPAFTVHVHGPGGQVYDQVCIGGEYPGVTLDSSLGAVNCDEDSDDGAADLPACSLCDGGSMIFYPTGEMETDGAVSIGETIVFAPRDGPPSSIRAVGVRAGIGRARAYRMEAGEWVCP